MKIACISDPHIRSVNPVNRIDNYQEAIFEKFNFILDYCDENKIECLVCSGDLFDTPRSSLSLVKAVVDSLKARKVKFLSVWGQHDVFYHQKTLENTPIGILESADVLTVLNDKPFKIQDTHIYGASWESEIPKIQDKTKTNILAIHKMVINEKLWKDQTEFVTAGSLLKNNDFDLIISGDNHQKFTQIYKGKKLVNCGSMMRNSVAQKDHQPAFFVYDTETKKTKEVLIPIKPFDEVSLVAEFEDDKEANKKLEEYKKALSNDVDSSGLEFEKNLTAFMKLIEVNENIMNIVGRSVNGNS